MLIIALLSLLGVDLIVIVAVAAIVLGRRRWVRRQPGAFRGVIRAADGEAGGLGPKWRRGYGRWVRDVLVWTRAPLMFRNAILPVDGQAGHRPARPGEVKRLGDNPVVVTMAVGSSRIEVAVRIEERERVSAPFPGAGVDPHVVPVPPQAERNRNLT